MAPIRILVAAVALLAASACGGDDSQPEVSTTTSTTLSATSSVPVSVGQTTSTVGGRTSATSPTRNVRDWDGVRFDIGIVDRIDRTEDGLTLIVFDRVQLETEGGRKSGKDFTEEPIVVGNTDYPFVNDNKSLRTYVAQRNVDVLRIANVRQTCADGSSAPPQWEAVTVDQVVARSLWKEYPQVSLTFSPEGFVSRLRLSSGC